MREIRFRAWDNVKNQMYYIGEESNVAFSFDSNGILAEDLTEHDWGFKKLEHLVHMQFTGLKDRNGREIYEGDILKLRLMDWCGIPLGQFTISSDAFHNDVCYIAEIIRCAESDWVEIVGNIYENPELLEQQR